ncbi:MAG: ribonuclease P protein component [Mycoplasmataceae bacterium]|nr:ribonuclease P protein component [Mycoplasmataceae bacterium]
MKKEYSLTSQNYFNKVINKGKKYHSKYFLFSVVDANSFKIGISVPKKLGNAVLRNKNKRQIKNIIHEIYPYANNKHIVMITKEPFIKLTYDEKLEILKKELEITINGNTK